MGTPEFEPDDDESEELTGHEDDWMEREFADKVGFRIEFRTFDGDLFGGIILGVKNGGIMLRDDHNNTVYCTICYIYAFCIYDKKPSKKRKKNADK